MTVVNLSEKRAEREPTQTGPAHCLSCRHGWTAVAPLGKIDGLECPGCHRLTGAFVGECTKGEETRWTCNCGNDLFRIVQAGTYCPSCGLWQGGYS